MAEVAKTINTEPTTPVINTTPAPPIESKTPEELQMLMNETDWSKTDDIQAVMKYIMLMNQQVQQKQTIPTPAGGGKIKKVVIDYE